MALVQGTDYPEHIFYDVENQIWYEPLADGTIRAGFTPWAVVLMGEILVFTPKRIGREFDKDRSFAVIEGGKWIGAAHAAFAGTVVSSNELLARKPELLSDAFGKGWMLVVRPKRDDWRAGLTTGPDITPVFETWIAGERYKARVDG